MGNAIPAPNWRRLDDMLDAYMKQGYDVLQIISMLPDLEAAFPEDRVTIVFRKTGRAADIVERI